MQADGTFLQQPIPKPTPATPSNTTSDNPWAPFQDRLAFDWAWYQYVWLQSSADNIQVGLDLWHAAVIKHASDHDSLEGWMEKTYDLNLQDVLGLLEQQLASTEFEGQFEYALFQEFDFHGDHVYSHLMSAFWANREVDTIAEDPQRYGAMLVPIFSGSDKTTVSVATGNQEYHPVYTSAEQVWLVCIVLNWCPKCDAQPENLDNPGSHCCSHAKTDFLINQWDPVSFIFDAFHAIFPQADIHELLAPDLLHQLIKGTFEDHLVEWVVEYLHITHREKGALEIIEDIDHRFTYYNQWTGDDSKALMKVFLAAIAGYVPSAMVHCIANFIDACYISC
ncbi:hypothetical protein F5148DRAFT_1274142 [Russula earlei]|uniref:Uncharacterized protein n=1 Tax=Russula earlei TaxID=71964 RepID=A0ACC0UKX1_9AGAM|nr:hypothetical protein F5148DRAFT_1274142 [Russula earlei]